MATGAWLTKVSLTGNTCTIIAAPSQSEVTGYFKSQKLLDGIADGLGDLNLNLSQGVFYDYPGSFFLILGTKPGQGTVQQFRVEVKADNDSTYTALSPVLQF